MVTIAAKINMASQSLCPAGYYLIHYLYLSMGCAVCIQKLLSRLSKNICYIVFGSAALSAALVFHWITISKGLTTFDMASLLM